MTSILIIKIEILIEKCGITLTIKLSMPVSQKLPTKLLEHKLHKILLPNLVLPSTHHSFVIRIEYEALSTESMVAFSEAGLIITHKQA